MGFTNSYMNMFPNMNMFAMNSYGFGGCNESLGMQIAMPMANLASGILSAYLSGVMSNDSTTGGGQSAAATVEEIEAEITKQKENATECEDYINNPEKYVDKSLLTKASDAFQKANTNLNTANTNLSTAETSLKNAETAYNKLGETERNKPENKQVVDAYEQAKKDLETAKTNQKKAQEAYNQAKENELKANNEYATNLKAVKENAEKKKTSIEADIAKLETKLEKAKKSALAEAGKEAKGNSRYLSKSEFAGLFDANGNLVKSPDTDYKAAANKAASAFLKSKSPDDANKFLKLYGQLTADEKKSFSTLVIEKAEEIAKQNSNGTGTTA